MTRIDISKRKKMQVWKPFDKCGEGIADYNKDKLSINGAFLYRKTESRESKETVNT